MARTATDTASASASVFERAPLIFGPMKASLPYRMAQAILWIALARHLALAFFIHPYADDLSYAVVGMTTPLGERLVQEYTSWNGRYFSNVLVLRGPLVLGLDSGLPLYRLAAVVQILLTALAFQRCLRVLAPRLPLHWSVTGALAWLLLYLHLIPDASEGFYWYTGAVTYQLANVLCVFIAIRWIDALRRPGVVHGWWNAQQALLVAMVVGSNEVHAAMLVLAHLGLWRWMRGGSPALRRAAGWLLLLALVCTLVVVVAPGNATRGALFPLRHDLVRTIGYSVAQTGRFTLQWVLVLVLPTVVFVALLRKGIRLGLVDPFVKIPNKWVALALPFAVVFICMVVTYWPTGILGQYRTIGMALFFFIPSWFWAVAVWDQVHFRPRGRWVAHADASAMRWTFVLLCTGALWAGRDGRVTADLLSGRMTRYDADMRQCYRAVAEAAVRGKEVVILPTVELPRCLKVLPLDTDATHWTNRSFAAYLGASGVLVSAAPPPATAP